MYTYLSLGGCAKLADCLGGGLAAGVRIYTVSVSGEIPLKAIE